MIERAGSARPLHPDQYGRREFVRGYDDDAILTPLTDAELEAMWEQEQESRETAAVTPIGKPHKHGCGHRCESEACTVWALIHDWNCEACREKAEAKGYWSR